MKRSRSFSEFWGTLFPSSETTTLLPGLRPHGGLDKEDLGTLARLARFDYLHGRVASAKKRLLAALLTASARMQPPRGTLARIRWQLGELAFSVGDYARAESWYRSGLVTHPTHIALLGSLAKLLAGAGRTTEAIRLYEKAIAIDPVPPI